jgi:hypothetical protein
MEVPLDPEQPSAIKGYRSGSLSSNRLPAVAGWGWFKSMLSEPPGKPKIVLEVFEKPERLSSSFGPGLFQGFLLRPAKDSSFPLLHTNRLLAVMGRGELCFAGVGANGGKH